MTDYQELRARHQAEMAAQAPEAMARLTWPAERLAEHRVAGLRRLLRVAVATSPWHRKRLAGLDPDEVDEATLGQLPVMTKDDLMDSFDEIVTDPRLTLDVVNAHLAALTTDGYLFDRYHAVASGGSSGRRGVFVYDWEGWATCFWTHLRHVFRALEGDPTLRGLPPRMAMVAAATPTHMTSALPRTFANPRLEVVPCPVTWPVADIVAGLNSAQPTLLVGFPSALHVLTAEAAAGRLHIAPAWVLTTSEPLLPETRAALETTFAVPVSNWYGTSEAGGSGAPCRQGPWLHLADDLMITEPVDAAGAPVAPGVRSERLFLTNLYNTALPLVRYEITDQVTVLPDAGPCPCGSTHRRIADPYGRADDVFDYDVGTGTKLRVHPHVFRSPLSRRAGIVEYQVHQTRRGAEIAIRCAGPVDLPALESEVARGLSALGLPEPAVTVRPVDAIPRQSSGKLRRFVPCAS
jgi:phenylacetate-coenzyme A ligase PaaK-like adenylate-forming protein